MGSHARWFFAAACLLAAALPAFAADAEDAERKKLASEGKFKIRQQKEGMVVDVAYKGDAKVGDVFDVRRGDDLIGYAEVAEMAGYWPKLSFLLGGGHEGDLLTRLAPPKPKAQLLTDDLECREARELRALVGDGLTVVKIGDKMRAPANDEMLIVLYHAGAPFMMGDPIVEPHAARGGKVVADMMAYCHIRGMDADESFFEAPPSLRIIDKGPLTRGLVEESRIPWCGTREVVVEVPLRSTSKSKSKSKEKPPTRKVKKMRYVARIAPGTMPRESMKQIATDESTEKSALLYEAIGGGILAVDLISLNGRGGIDPGCKNKWLFVARALGGGPTWSAFRPAKPEWDDIAGEIDSFQAGHPDSVKKVMEGGGSGDGNLVSSLAFGPEGKPLVLLVGGISGNDWLGSVALLRVVELLINPEDWRMDWVRGKLRIKIVPCLNIAGYKKGTAANANGVELGRNFPYQWAEQADKKGAGSEPFSEPETAILKRLIEDEKPVAVLDIGVDPYDKGYGLVRARDADAAQRGLLRVVRDVVNARIRHRYVLGDKPLTVPLFKGGAHPSLANWAGTMGALAASLRICGDGEDSLTNTDVAIETTLAFLYATALAREPAPQPPARPKPVPRRTRRSTRK